MPAALRKQARSLHKPALQHICATVLLASLCAAVPVAAEVPCGEKLGIPKVAVLFLARGGMPLTSVWQAWLKPVAGLIPIQATEKKFCLPGVPSGPPSAVLQCTAPVGTALQAQMLYSFYVHSSRIRFKDFPAGDLFQGTMISNLTHAGWGDTTRAVRELLRAALLEPRNQRFILLSDADIPLYPATMTYLQLFQEDKIRLEACTEFLHTDLRRYSCLMAFEGGVQPWHWRKSALWMSMPRHHAEFIAEEMAVRTVFERHCSNIINDPFDQRFRGCLVDEHYYGTLFAMHNRHEETDCKGVLTVAEFREGGDGHPVTYAPAELNSTHIRQLGQPIGWLGKANCSSPAHYVQARAGFVSMQELKGVSSDAYCTRAWSLQRMPPMESWCQLFLRKFGADAAAKLIAIFAEGAPGVSWV